MAKQQLSGEEAPKYGFSAFRPGIQDSMNTLSEQLLERLRLTLNLSIQHFRGEPYRRPNVRYFNSGLANRLVTGDCVGTLSSIALGASHVNPGILEQRSIRIAGIERRQHERSGSYYICAIPDTYSTGHLNEERRLLLNVTAAAFNRSAKGLLADEEFEITFARLGSKTKPADLGHVSLAHSIIVEHCPERIKLEPPFFQTRNDEVFAINSLADHADAAGIAPVSLYPQSQ